MDVSVVYTSPPRLPRGGLEMDLKNEEQSTAVEILTLMRGGAPGFYYVAYGPPRCGVIKVKLMHLPTNIEPPFKAKLIKTKNGTALVEVNKLNLDDVILENIENVIEGEVENGVLEGVVCNRKIKLAVADRKLHGPVLAIIPVARKTKKIPPAAFHLFTYSLQLV